MDMGVFIVGFVCVGFTLVWDCKSDLVVWGWAKENKKRENKRGRDEKEKKEF